MPVSNAIVRANGRSPRPKQQHRSHTTIVILSPSISQLLLLTCEVSGIIVHNSQLTSQCHPEFIEGSGVRGIPFVILSLSKDLVAQASVPVSNAIVRANGRSPRPQQQHRSHTTIVILSPSISQLLLLTCEVSCIIVHNSQLTSQCHPEPIEGSGVWGIPFVILSLSKDLVAQASVPVSNSIVRANGCSP